MLYSNLKRLKILPVHFDDVIKRNKRSELRFNDRNFKVGDIYSLEEYCDGVYTGRSAIVQITHVLENIDGLIDGWCVFSFRLCKKFIYS